MAATTDITLMMAMPAGNKRKKRIAASVGVIRHAEANIASPSTGLRLNMCMRAKMESEIVVAVTTMTTTIVESLDGEITLPQNVLAYYSIQIVGASTVKL